MLKIDLFTLFARISYFQKPFSCYRTHLNFPESASKMEGDEYMLFVQLLVVGSVACALLTYLLRAMVCKAKNDIGSKAVLVTGCDSGIGHELARHLDSLGVHVFAGCLDTGGEGAQRLRVECSPFLR